MRARTLLYLTSVIGTVGALLLAGDMYRRIKEAECLSAAAAREVPGVLAFGLPHTLGLLALALLFLGLLLLLSASNRAAEAVADAAPEKPASEAPPPLGTCAPLHEIALQEIPPEAPVETPAPTDPATA